MYPRSQEQKKINEIKAQCFKSTCSTLADYERKFLLEGKTVPIMTSARETLPEDKCLSQIDSSRHTHCRLMPMMEQ